MVEVPWYAYAIFIAFVVAMLVIDLRFFHQDESEPSLRQSAGWVAVWVALAIVFGVGVWIFDDGQSAGEYFAGYLIEYSLSVDNMFVFVLIFTYFRVPFAYQHQVLFYGILGAIIFRGLFIAAGQALVSNFHWVIYVFGAFLIYTAVRIARGVEEVHPENNPVINFVSRRTPSTKFYDGHKLFTVVDGARAATPLFIALLFIELTDILFAVDSIPAIFGVTEDPFIMLTSNVFAVLGLRALYFLLAGGMDRFHLLRYGLAIVLGFVGVKMLLEAIPCSEQAAFCQVETHAQEGHIALPIWASLAFIVTVLAATVILSLKVPPPEDGTGSALLSLPDPKDVPQNPETHPPA